MGIDTIVYIVMFLCSVDQAYEMIMNMPEPKPSIEQQIAAKEAEIARAEKLALEREMEYKIITTPIHDD